MNTLSFLKAYGMTLFVFLSIDMVWLLAIAKNFYAKHLGYLMSPTPILPAAFLFYLINVVGIVVFIIMPSLSQSSIIKPLLLGALFGLCTYATYDLTNYATIKDWPFIIVVVDLLWGTVLTATVSVIGFLLAKRFL